MTVSTEVQYRLATASLASRTMPVVLSTVCFVPVTLLRLGEEAERITGVPRPAVNERLSIGDVFVKMVPAVPENGQPLSGAVA